MESVLEPAPWLTGESIGLRAPLVEDAAHPERWYIGTMPDDPEAVERALVQRESIPWGGNPVITLVAIGRVDSRILGGVVAVRAANRTCRLEVMAAPDHDDRAGLLREVLGLVVPWLLDEVGLMTVVLQAPSDDDALIAAAGATGMVEAVRRREHVVRAHDRVDLLQLERVNMDWGRHAG